MVGSRSRTANAKINPRFSVVFVSGLGVTIIPPPGSWANAVTVGSISPAVRTPTGIIVIPSPCAASLAASRKATLALTFGLWRTAIRRRSGGNLVQHFEPLSSDRRFVALKTGYISARLGEACNKSASHRIGHLRENDWDGGRHLLQSNNRDIRCDKDDIWRICHQFRRRPPDQFGTPARKSIVNRNISTFSPTKLG